MSDVGETVTIPKSEYDELVCESEKLQALENWGVNNWEWYDDAMGEYRANKAK